MKQKQLQETIDFLHEKGFVHPELGIVLGTGLGKLVDEITRLRMDILAME